MVFPLLIAISAMNTIATGTVIYAGVGAFFLLTCTICTTHVFLPVAWLLGTVAFCLALNRKPAITADSTTIYMLSEHS